MGKRGKSRKKPKNFAGICPDCGTTTQVKVNEWYHASRPRCPSCGGFLLKSKDHEAVKKFTYKGDYPVDWEKIRKHILKRDKSRCFVCGKTDRMERRDKKQGLSVHHINGRKADCVPENLITLCEHCHLKRVHKRTKTRCEYPDLQSIKAIKIQCEQSKKVKWLEATDDERTIDVQAWEAYHLGVAPDSPEGQHLSACAVP